MHWIYDWAVDSRENLEGYGMKGISNLEQSQMRLSQGRGDVAGGSNAILFLSLEVRDDVKGTRLVVLGWRDALGT